MSENDTVTLIGEKPDGSAEVLGTIPTPPSIKRGQIARDYFGGCINCINPDEDDVSDAYSCLLALEEYHNWLVAQGWLAPKLEIVSK
jgi:hypothetical protein